MIRKFLTSAVFVAAPIIGIASSAHAVDESPVVNIQCITANPDAYSTAKDTAVSFSDTSVLSNDVAGCDHNIDDFHFSNITNPSNGSLTHTGGNFKYTPENGFTGTDTFEYTLELDQPVLEATTNPFVSTTTVTITVSPTSTTAEVLDTEVEKTTTTDPAVLAATGGGIDTAMLGAAFVTTGSALVGTSAIARRRIRGSRRNAS